MQALFTDEPEHICTAPDPAAACERVRQNWRRMLFSDLPDHSLRRYFTRQLAGIPKVRDTLLAELTEHLLANYRDYIDRDAAAPESFRERMVTGLTGQLTLLKANRGLGEIVQSYIREIENPERGCFYSFRALDYFRLLVSELGKLKGQSANDLLLSLNFNHLNYLSQLQHDMTEHLAALGNDGLRKKWLTGEQARIRPIPENTNTAYHPDWPSLKTMLSGWLTEQLLLLPDTAGTTKLPLNLSVAQLACLIKLFYEEELYKETNLTAIFTFYASAFTTKKQAAISPGSLSKEYYGTDQVTAAVVLDKLQKMAARINRNFFPALIAAGAAILFR